MVHQDLSTSKWLWDWARLLVFWVIGLVLFELGLWAFLILTSMVLKDIGNTAYTFLDIRSNVAWFAMAAGAVAYLVGYIIRGQERSSISIKIENFTDYELDQHIAYCQYVRANSMNHNIPVKKSKSTKAE
jgi:hypothetical protein